MATTSRKKARRFAGRLLELKQETGYSVEEFAKHFRAKPTTVRDWLNAYVLPRTEALVAIATHFGVTTDWLLGLPDAPKYPKQSRSDADLSADLASAIQRAVHAQHARDGRRWRVDGDHYLRVATEAAKRDAVARLAFEDNWRGIRGHVQSLDKVASALKRSPTRKYANLESTLYDIAGALMQGLNMVPMPGETGLALDGLVE